MKLKIAILSLTMLLTGFSANAQTVKEKDLLGKYFFARVLIGQVVVFDGTSEQACINTQLTILKTQNPEYKAIDSVDVVKKAQETYKMARQSTMEVKPKGETLMVSPGSEASKATWTFDEKKQEFTTLDENGVKDTFTVKLVGKTITLSLAPDENGQQIELLKE